MNGPYLNSNETNFEDHQGEQNGQTDNMRASDVRSSRHPGFPTQDSTEPERTPSGGNTVPVPKWCICTFLVFLVIGCGVVVVIVLEANAKPRYWLPPEVSFQTSSYLGVLVPKVGSTKI